MLNTKENKQSEEEGNISEGLDKAITEELKENPSIMVNNEFQNRSSQDSK